MALVAILLPAGAALAHDGLPPEPHDLRAAWSFDPLVVATLVVSAGLYARGTRALWARAGAGRGVKCWRAAAYAGGLVALIVALVSPLDALGSALLSAHMAQHLLLVVVAAPLLVLGAPLLPLLWALPAARRGALGRCWLRATPVRVVWGVLRRPLVAWLLHAAALWGWHAPPLYQAALRSESVHVAEHLSFLGTALLFWWTALAPPSARHAGVGLGVLSIFAMSLHGGLLGALMTFAPTPWYPIYLDRTAPWGLTPLADQQLAGLLMWIPTGTVYLAAALGLLAICLRVPAHR